MFIAWREFRRSIGRFALLTAAVGLLVLLLLFFQAVAGTLTSGLTGAFESADADAFVFDERARRNPSTSVLPPPVADEVAQVEGVESAVGVGLGVFTGTGPDGELDVAVVGGQPGGPSSPAELSEGDRPSGPDEAVFSGSTFDESLAVGDVVEVGGREIRVVGVADGAAYNVLPTLYVPFETCVAVVQDRAGAPIDVPLSLVAVTVVEGADAGEVAAEITAQVEGVDALDAATTIDELPGVGQVTQSFSILYLLLFIVVTIVTGVFFLILTVQKAEALVLLRAVGASRADVVRPVLLQVVAVVGIGAVGGAALASGLLAAARDTFGATLSPGTTAVTVGIILLLGLLASLGAVRRVLAIDPVAAVAPGGM
ncbi:FtsX-like permease family protein [Euzebya sp.]|uniref:ABC transporter permease n=1 Tax=Euzebya sp. TaxID=1971409 RepID=UPI0035177FFA